MFCIESHKTASILMLNTTSKEARRLHQQSNVCSGRSCAAPAGPVKSKVKAAVDRKRPASCLSASLGPEPVSPGLTAVSLWTFTRSRTTPQTHQRAAARTSDVHVSSFTTENNDRFTTARRTTCASLTLLVFGEAPAVREQKDTRQEEQPARSSVNTS